MRQRNTRINFFCGRWSVSETVSLIPLFLLVFLASCTTTTVQTPPPETASEEERFFHAMSRKDPAFYAYNPAYGNETMPGMDQKKNSGNTGGAGVAALPVATGSRGNGESCPCSTPQSDPGMTAGAGVVATPVGYRNGNGENSSPSRTSSMAGSDRSGISADPERDQKSTADSRDPQDRKNDFPDRDKKDPGLRDRSADSDSDRSSSSSSILVASALPPQDDGRKETPPPGNQSSYFPLTAGPTPAARKNDNEDDGAPELIVEPVSATGVTGGAVLASSRSTESAAGGFSSPGNGEEFYQVGTASWYGRDFDGRKTASGVEFDSRKLTGAHKTIPLGSIVLVRNMENGKEILVKINDRGPYVGGRVLDLSEYGAELLGYKNQGLTTVGIKIVQRGNGEARGRGVTAAYYGKKDPGFTESASGSDQTGDADSSSNAEEARGGDPEVRSRLSASREEPVSINPETSLDAYAVQVGIFEDRENALSLKHYLASYGVPVHVLKRDSMYVVKVGEFQSRYAAEQMKYQLVADGYNGFISSPSDRP